MSIHSTGIKHGKMRPYDEMDPIRLFHGLHEEISYFTPGLTLRPKLTVNSRGRM